MPKTEKIHISIIEFSNIIMAFWQYMILMLIFKNNQSEWYIQNIQHS